MTRRSTSLFRMMHAAQTFVHRRLATTLSQRAAGIASALILGDTSGIDNDDLRVVRASSTVHLIAVSGMHVVLICGSIVWALRKILLRTRLARQYDVARIAALGGALIAPLYAEFAGSSMSAWRAAVMAAAVWLCRLSNRRLLSPRALTLSVLALLIYAPTSVLDIGFALSVAATWGLLASHRPLPTALFVASLSTITQRGRYAVAAFLRASLGAQAATTPIVLVAFKTVAPLGLLANLLITPTLGAALVPVATLHCIVACFVPGAAGASGTLCTWLFEAYLWSCAAFAWSMLWPLTAAQVIVCIATIASGFARRWRLACAGILTLIILEAVMRMPPRHTEVYFLDIGQGDAALIRFASGQNMMVDVGPQESSSTVLQVLAALRVTRLDTILLTHGHPDHFGALRDILQTVCVTTLWTNGSTLKDPVSDADPHYAPIMIDARKRGVAQIDTRTFCGRVLPRGLESLRILHPCGYDVGEAENDNSVVLALQSHHGTILFAGDIETRAESQLVATLAELSRPVTLLKVPHHGSRTSSTTLLLDALRPTHAFVSCGFGNLYGHPHAGVVERYHGAGVALHVSATHGGLLEVLTDRVPLVSTPVLEVLRSCRVQ